MPEIKSHDFKGEDNSFYLSSLNQSVNHEPHTNPDLALEAGVGSEVSEYDATRFYPAPGDNFGSPEIGSSELDG